MSLVAVAVSALAIWDPFEPKEYHRPSDRCVTQFYDWATDNSGHYGFCGNGTKRLPSIAEKANVNVGRCVDFCSDYSYVNVGDRWLAAEWDPSSGACTCKGVVTQDTYEGLNLSLAPYRKGCDQMILWVPLSCMWASERECIEAPGAPHGCLWTRESCCVDALGYEPPPLVFWPLPWWMWVGSGVFISIFAAALIFSHLHPPRALDVHRPPDDPGVETPHRSNLKKTYTKLLKTLVLTVGDTVEDGCCICLEDLKPSCSAVELKCTHVFHFKCMNEYVLHQVHRGVKYPRCPICRERVLDENEADLCSDDELEVQEQEMQEISHPHSSSGSSQHLELLAEPPGHAQHSAITLTINEADGPTQGDANATGVV